MLNIQSSDGNETSTVSVFERQFCGVSLFRFSPSTLGDGWTFLECCHLKLCGANSRYKYSRERSLYDFIVGGKPCLESSKSA